MFRAQLQEKFNVGGHLFSRSFRLEAQRAQDIAEQISAHSSILGVFTPRLVRGKYLPREDYTGTSRSLHFRLCNSASLIVDGLWRGEAQSDSHIAPYAQIDCSIGAPIGSRIRDSDVAAIFNHLTSLGCSVVLPKKPSDYVWYRDRAVAPDEATFKINQ